MHVCASLSLFPQQAKAAKAQNAASLLHGNLLPSFLGGIQEGAVWAQGQLETSQFVPGQIAVCRFW